MSRTHTVYPPEFRADAPTPKRAQIPESLRADPTDPEKNEGRREDHPLGGNGGGQRKDRNRQHRQSRLVPPDAS